MLLSCGLLIYQAASPFLAPLPARIYAGEGLAQVLFLAAAEICETSYKDRSGKYQSQRGITVPRI